MFPLNLSGRAYHALSYSLALRKSQLLSGTAIKLTNPVTRKGSSKGESHYHFLP